MSLTSNLLDVIYRSPLISPTELSPAQISESIPTLSLFHISHTSCTVLWDSITFHITDSLVFPTYLDLLDDNPVSLLQVSSPGSLIVICPPGWCPFWRLNLIDDFLCSSPFCVLQFTRLSFTSGSLYKKLSKSPAPSLN